jgi:hypothetical protein
MSKIQLRTYHIQGSDDRDFRFDARSWHQTLPGVVQALGDQAVLAWEAPDLALDLKLVFVE